MDLSGAANAAAGRRRMEAQAKLQLIEIERCCQLTGDQKSRLELAARGDFQRFKRESGIDPPKIRGNQPQRWRKNEPGVAGDSAVASAACARSYPLPTRC